MLPVALTSPLWWVARGITRLLTGLAVAIALSLAGPALSDPALPGAALPDPGPPAARPIDWSLSFGVPPVLDPASGNPDDVRTADRGFAPVGVAPVGVVAAGRVDAAAFAAPQRSDQFPAAVDAARIVPAAPATAPAGRTPAAAGSRAPPQG
ncbi:hypothetical protein ACIG87_29950 [Micromonospora sp. NPDC051925]|uniref:hypothetical protein n=1 Tax=Micromonospora sp. NPDC051925 TaxID=3364288 RepID=UPI0037C6C2CD